ncbi:MATE family efflux transporter [Devosia rhodophyticola]|uniref:Multidrug export protein MepA n=1 Tax=Devosia rhodophyticola TaxID=3026423 RepID=A0ABY7YXD8_9HYPH|nr:MATE family efflux transporter [Devosia rhodophyticola]WDR06053.1 MATE family efflux transporter [Devosia rhodophyticola]
MMSSQHASENRFLTASPGRIFVANALPMMLIMMMSGLLTVVDAAFLGHFVGADALAAVSVVFPIIMITIALSTLVGGGMSSLLARHLGAGNHSGATAVFAQAHGLALLLSLLLILTFGIGGGVVIDALANGQPDISRMAYTYLAIMILATPVQLLLSVHADAWRNEGRAGLMALMSVGVTFANIALNYVLIVRLDMGVAGSAWGTAIAQGLGLALLVGLRSRGGGILSLSALRHARWVGKWRAILTLGAPVSLSFIGIALVSATVIATLRLTSDSGYVEDIAAYGIVTRIFSFAFMPLMAIALATQSIVGNNVGAKLYQRSNAVLRLALTVSVFYCAAIEVILLAENGWIGSGFVTDLDVIAQVGKILRPMASLYLFAGPVLVLALYFQAIGRPGHTAALTLIKPFVLSPLLIAALGTIYGAQAIWFAFPIADGIVVTIALWIVIVCQRDGKEASGFGLPEREEA